MLRVTMGCSSDLAPAPSFDIRTVMTCFLVPFTTRLHLADDVLATAAASPSLLQILGTHSSMHACCLPTLRELTVIVCALPILLSLPVSCSLQIQFDNRGSKVEAKKDTLIKAVAKMLKVDPKQVSMNVIGQSGLLNHQVRPVGLKGARYFGSATRMARIGVTLLS